MKQQTLFIKGESMSKNSNQSNKQEDILFFSSDDWGWKTSKYQLSTRLAQQGKVLFVSSIGFRAPTASSEDLGRIWRKLKNFVQGTKEVQPNLHVLTPLVIPFQNFPMKDKINHLILKMQITVAMKQLKMKKPLMFVFSQNWLPYIKHIDRKKCIYYVVDDQSSFKGLNAEQFKAWDQEMSQYADGIFCTAKSLFDNKKALNQNTFYMPHGVDFNNFYRTWSDTTPAAASMLKLPQPRILFFGHISHDWVDAELLKKCAALKPDWSWVLVGRNSMSDNEFAQHANIHYLGEQEFADLPQFCKAADVGIIPFVQTPLTYNCNPLKLPEYVAAGLPVVSTPIPSVSELYPEDAAIAATPEEFVMRCEEALKKTNEQKHIRALAMQEHTWEMRVDKILGHIENDLPSR